jgi:palmitoyl-protein thioesterase
MDDSVDALHVAADSNLQKGFHAIGFSQGNNIIRGYIARVNSPAVHVYFGQWTMPVMSFRTVN